MVLDAMKGRRVRVLSAFRAFRHPIRFAFLSSATVLGAGMSLLSLLFVSVAVLPFESIPPPFVPDIESARGILTQIISEKATARLPASQENPNRDLIGPVLVGVSILTLGALTIFLRCFYLPLVAAQQHLPLVEAYVECRNTIRRHGYARHLILMVMAVLIVVIPYQVPIDNTPARIAILILIPLALGLIASAYHQTVGVEEANLRLQEQQFVEMRDERQIAHGLQMDLLPDTPRPGELPSGWRVRTGQ